MKKTVLGLVCLLLICCGALTACMVTPIPPDGPPDDGEGIAEITKLIKPASADYDIDYDQLKEDYYSNADLMLYQYDDDDESEGAGELCIGETNRSVTATAKAQLAAEVKKANNDDQIGYIIYSDGDSVAFFWDDRYSLKVGYAYFYENFVLKGVDSFESGIVKLETMDKSEAKKAQEAIDKAADFAEVARILGSSAAEALSAHYDLYDERFYIWMAELYDPGVGGFYFSNTALANEGFLPDVESTQQAIAFFGNAGMYKAYDGVADAIPEWMQKQLINFARELQSPDDGYFYHPQWGTEITPSRLSRDLGWATAIITQFGAKPKWNAPNGTKGEYGAPPNSTAMAGRLAGGSSASAVSSLVRVASLSVNQYPERLRSIENWRYYLIVEMNGSPSVEDLTAYNIRTKSYSIGNEVGSQSSQIIQRDKLAIENGELPDANNDGIADGGYIETFEELFNLWQLDYNGLWEHNKSKKSVTGEVIDDSEGETYYNAINGLMKISSAYNSLGVKLPHAEEALESAVYMITYVNEQTDGRPGADVKGKRPSAVVDVYNPWVCTENILVNIEDYGNDSEAAELQSILQRDAVNMIRSTTAKTVHFRKEDGSFGYSWEASGALSQGVPVTLEGVNEGGINGGAIAVSGITRNMCATLGVKNIPIYRDSDWDVCLEIFESASPIQKNTDIEIETPTRDFEDYDVGMRNEEIDCLATNNSDMKSGYLEVAEAPVSESGRNWGEGNALKFVAAATGLGDTLKIVPGGKGTSCFVLEFDIYVEEVNKYNQTIFQISMDSAYRLTVNVDKDGAVYLGDSNAYSSSPDYRNLGIYFNMGEWHRIRVEYYPSDAENVKTKIYFDEQLRAVSDNYYGKNNPSVTTPATKFTVVSFYSLYPCMQTTYFDNLFTEKSDAVYTEETVVTPYLVKDFETENSLYQATVGSAQVVNDPDESDKALHINGATTVIFPNSSTASTVNCFAVELGINAANMGSGDYFNLYLDSSDVKSSPVAWRIVCDGRYLSIYEVTSSVGSEAVSAEPIAEDIPADGWEYLRFEYYRYQYDDAYTGCKSIIYLRDGEEYAEIGRGNAYYEVNNLKYDYTTVTFVSSSNCDVYLDDIIPTREYKEYLDEDGRLVADNDAPFPTGGQEVSNPATSSHDGIFDFEDSALGLATSEGFSTDINQASYGNEIEVVEDPTGYDRGNVLEVKTVRGDSGNSSIFEFSKVGNGNIIAFEYEIYMEYNSGADKYMQCFIRDSAGKNIAACSFDMTLDEN